MADNRKPQKTRYQGVAYVIGGNSYRGRKAFLVAGFVLPAIGLSGLTVSHMLEEQNTDLAVSLGSRGEKIAQSNIPTSEKVLVKLRGKFGEGLVITDRHIYILKWGFMAGSTFGGRCIAYPFKNISGVKITKNILTGVFEVMTPGNQDAPKSYWGNKNSAIKADDAVAFVGSKTFEPFQKAANLCRDLIAEAHQ